MKKFTNDIKVNDIRLPQSQETKESSHEVITATPAKNPNGSINKPDSNGGNSNGGNSK